MGQNFWSLTPKKCITIFKAFFPVFNVIFIRFLSPFFILFFYISLMTIPPPYHSIMHNIYPCKPHLDLPSSSSSTGILFLSRNSVLVGGYVLVSESCSFQKYCHSPGISPIVFTCPCLRILSSFIKFMVLSW